MPTLESVTVNRPTLSRSDPVISLPVAIFIALLLAHATGAFRRAFLAFRWCGSIDNAVSCSCLNDLKFAASGSGWTTDNKDRASQSVLREECCDLVSIILRVVNIVHTAKYAPLGSQLKGN